MGKIQLDKYYTNNDLAEYIVTKTKEIIGNENITEYIEPSAGAGAFLNFLNKPYLAYDIEPEDNRIVKQDFLTLELEYKKGRCVIGNPPYGVKHMLAFQFYKKSIQLGDYIAFILPISQYKNDSQMYDFELIYSEDLGKKKYSDKEVWCCFNIYKRPINGLNKKPNYDFKKDLEIRVYLRGRTSSYEITKKENFNYDIRVCTFGMAGKESSFEGQFVKEMCIKINNNKYKKQILKLLREVNWEKVYPKTTNSFNLAKWQVYKYLKEQIPEIY